MSYVFYDNTWSPYIGGMADRFVVIAYSQDEADSLVLLRKILGINESDDRIVLEFPKGYLDDLGLLSSILPNDIYALPTNLPSVRKKATKEDIRAFMSGFVHEGRKFRDDEYYDREGKDHINTSWDTFEQIKSLQGMESFDKGYEFKQYIKNKVEVDKDFLPYEVSPEEFAGIIATKLLR